MVQRYVLNKIKDKRLRVYVVWLPIRGPDNEAAAKESVQYLVDPRVRHFWVDDLSIPESFKKPLKLKKELAWDLYLLFRGDATWGSLAPVPSLAMHLDRDEMPDGTSLNGIKLADEVRNLLASSPGSQY